MNCGTHNGKPLLILTANAAWNVYSRRNLIRALQGAGFSVFGMGAAGSMTGTKRKAGGAKPAQQDEYTRRLEEELGVPFFPLPMMEGDGTNPCKDMALFFTFLRVYRKYRPAAVLHFNNKPDIYGSMAASLCRIPSFNNITGLGAAAEKTGLTGKIVYRLYKTAFRSPKAFVFFQNRDDREFFISRALCPPERTEILPGSGVDTVFFSPDSGTAEPFSLQKSGPCFLFLGRLLVSKGCGDFIRAAETVKRKHPEARFLLAGEHNPENPAFLPRETLEQALSAGTVEWAGVQKDVRPCIRNADCVVLPSYYREGVPRVLLEAAAMGKALIAADCPGTREPVEDGVNGFLCEPRNPENLAEKMSAWISLPETEKIRMQKASRRTAETRFSDKLVADAYIRQLSAFCSPAPSAP